MALLHADLSTLHRPILKLDPSKEAAISGQSLISVGYATGLDAIRILRNPDDAVRVVAAEISQDEQARDPGRIARGRAQPFEDRGCRALETAGVDGGHVRYNTAR